MSSRYEIHEVWCVRVPCHVLTFCVYSETEGVFFALWRSERLQNHERPVEGGPAGQGAQVRHSDTTYVHANFLCLVSLIRRGFGFVTYANIASVNAVLQAGPHVLDNKKVPLSMLMFTQIHANISALQCYLGGKVAGLSFQLQTQ